jgi:hypothetical protein
MDKISFKDLKQAAAIVADAFGTSQEDTTKIIVDYRKSGNQVSKILAGDLSDARSVAQSLGIETGKPQERKVEKKATRKTTEKKTKNKKKESDFNIIEGDVVLQELPHELPPELPETIESLTEAFCNKYDIENMSKARQTQWAALCRFIGQTVFKKNRGILADRERARRNGGGFCYDLNKVSKLADLWIYLCSLYNKAPFVDDFSHFSGLDEVTLYGVGGDYTAEDKVTPERLHLLQKLREAQESGLAGLIVDGRQNPTGALAALNHWHGWTQTREVIHTAGNAAPSAPVLPVFDASAGSLLEIKDGES